MTVRNPLDAAKQLVDDVLARLSLYKWNKIRNDTGIVDKLPFNQNNNPSQEDMIGDSGVYVGELPPQKEKYKI